MSKLTTGKTSGWARHSRATEMANFAAAVTRSRRSTITTLTKGLGFRIFRYCQSSFKRLLFLGNTGNHGDQLWQLWIVTLQWSRSRCRSMEMRDPIRHGIYPWVNESFSSSVGVGFTLGARASSALARRIGGRAGGVRAGRTSGPVGAISELVEPMKTL